MSFFGKLVIQFVVILLSIPICTAQERAPFRVSLMLGDSASSYALRAVEELLAQNDLPNVEFRVFPRRSPELDARRFIQFSDISLIYTHDREFVFDIAEDLQLSMGRGGRALSVSSVFDPDVAELGIRQSRRLLEYFETGGYQNILTMLKLALADAGLMKVEDEVPLEVPEVAYYDIQSTRFFTHFEDYAAEYELGHPGSNNRPWVGLYINRTSVVSSVDPVIVDAAKVLEEKGMNVLTGFGYPGTQTEVLFLDEHGNSRIEVMVAFALKLGNIVDEIAPVLSRLDVPIINAITLYNLSAQEWEDSVVGLDFNERSWQLGGPELAGAIAPTVVGTKELVVDPVFGTPLVQPQSIHERMEQLAERAWRFVRLRMRDASDRKVAVVYYNYPPGRENIGASYLNVLAGSLWQITNRMQIDGYTMPGSPDNEDSLFQAVRTWGNNPSPSDDTGEYLDKLARSGKAQLVAVKDYSLWLQDVPKILRDAMIDRWGEPENSDYMLWRDDSGEPYFVFPSQRWGNVIFAAQPARTGDRNITQAYHDMALPPHHQYLAFYLWLQNQFDADVMVHVGTHATHEWLPGREAGFTEADASEVMVGSVPQIYPYIVDVIGEGLQAKRRGMAAVITHMTPPLDKASLNPELVEINGLLNDIHQARETGSFARVEMIKELTERAEKMGMLTDLSIELDGTGMVNEDEISAIEHHVQKIGETLTPFGLHTFGVAPEPAMQEATVNAMMAMEGELAPEEYDARRAQYLTNIQASARAELDSLSAGLAGRYISAGPGNDPVRNPASLPTGKNFYGFDPSRLPTPASYTAGSQLAADFVSGYLERHEGIYPDRVVFNLFAGETNRHGGSMEGQILNLMGVRPTWGPRGNVLGVELIPKDELGRPRVDVTVVPSGLYRDQYPVLMLLMDQAVNLVREAELEGNPIRENIESLVIELTAQGIESDQARRLASVRVFTEPSGTYGTGLSDVIQEADSWVQDQEISDVYFRRVGHLFGQGFWGDLDKDGNLAPQLAEDVFKAALRGAKAVVHSRTSNVYGTLDNDDFYQYLGGTSMAVRQLDGTAPETLVADLSDPNASMTVTLERFMGEEMRARYLNPKWINEMLDEGYAGARFVRQIVDNLWGWQVTTPDAIDDAKWQEMYEVYVEDRYDLEIEKRFEEAENLAAYQALVERMMTAIDKGYWDASEQTREELSSTVERLAPVVAAQEAAIASMMGAAPALGPQAPAAPSSVTAMQPTAAPMVEGRVLEERALSSNSNAGGNSILLLVEVILMLFASILMFYLGWMRQGLQLK